MAETTDGVRFERRGVLGLITLDRPKVLNALTHDMILAIEAQLDAWAGDEDVAVVTIIGAGEKAFCAGGDVRTLWETGRPGGARGQANWRFYADEYRLNAKIQRYPKPYVALMDGIVMGGGVGVSLHGRIRIATERTVFAMPETGIGLFPDVGATWFLPRLPGEIGLWLGLTGTRLRTVDVVASGLCDHFVPADRLDQLLETLTRLDPTDPQALDWDIEAFARQPEGPSVLDDHRERIDRIFAGDGVEAVLERLAETEHYWAAEQREAIVGKSPTCTRIAFRQIREGAGLTFEDCMRLEYRLARFCMTHGDFYEGVRATIIEKDGAPAWSPASLKEADDAFVAPAFAPLGSEELAL